VEACRCGSLPVLVDGGIRRGTDVLKAMALGATAQSSWAARRCGALPMPARRASPMCIRLLRDELEVAMALSGCRTLADVSREVLLHPATGNFTIDSEQ
jgi:4-hydroxymandelate oxidase